MKKMIMIVVAAFIATITASSCAKENFYDPAQNFYPGSENTPILMEVSPDFSLATLNYGGQMIQVQTTYSPLFDDYGNIIRPGRNGQGVLTVPPIRPQSWEQTPQGGLQSNGFVYNPGYSASQGSCWVVRGNWTTNGQSLQFSVVRVSGFWAKTPNPSTWVGMYQPGTYQPPIGWYSFVQIYLGPNGYTLGI